MCLISYKAAHVESLESPALKRKNLNLASPAVIGLNVIQMEGDSVVF